MYTVLGICFPPAYMSYCLRVCVCVHDSCSLPLFVSVNLKVTKPSCIAMARGATKRCRQAEGRENPVCINGSLLSLTPLHPPSLPLPEKHQTHDDPPLRNPLSFSSIVGHCLHWLSPPHTHQTQNDRSTLIALSSIGFCGQSLHWLPPHSPIKHKTAVLSVVKVSSMLGRVYRLHSNLSPPPPWRSHCPFYVVGHLLSTLQLSPISFHAVFLCLWSTSCCVFSSCNWVKERNWL